MKSFQVFKDRLLANPRVRAAYQAKRDEFVALQALIKARLAVKLRKEKLLKKS